MKIRGERHIAAIAVLLITAACKSVPSYVIDPNDMAAILADIHIGESVIEVNRQDYRTDSAKQVMLQSVLELHGYTQQDLDTSYVWYGHNINKYMDVYDKTIEILERRLAETGNRIAAENISIAGDSVDVWSNQPQLAINYLSPTQILTFSLSGDENWERGDSYTWRAKSVNSSDDSNWGIAAEYQDGSIEIINSTFGTEGWNELKFISDSTKTAVRLYGYLNTVPRTRTTMFIDSIMLIRNRVSPETYNQHYRQQRISPKNLREISEVPVEKTDSIE